MWAQWRLLNKKERCNCIYSFSLTESLCYTLETNKALLINYELNWTEVAQSCPILCDPVDSSPPDSSVHGILQARILEWVAISFSRGSSRPRDQTHVSRVAGRFFTIWWILTITVSNLLLSGPEALEAKQFQWLILEVGGVRLVASNAAVHNRVYH